MKALVVYYSRTGNNRKIAGEIAEALGADVEELKERASREGPMGYLLAGRDAMRKRPAELEPLAHRPADYDLVILGGPVWAFTMCTPTRTYALEHKHSFRLVAFFSTAADARFTRKAIQALTDACGKAPIATLVLSDVNVARDHRQAVTDFVASLNSHGTAD
jgi:hypothetical protein